MLCCKPPFNKVFKKYMLFDEEWDMVELVTDFLDVSRPLFYSLLFGSRIHSMFLQLFRKASKRMAGEKYPTLSFSLVSYIKLLDHISAFRARVHPTGDLELAIDACEAKLRKYFVYSSSESIYYYIALGMLYASPIC